MASTFYKATRLDGSDFWTGTISYADALGGAPIAVPEVEKPQCYSGDVLHATAIPTAALSGGSWPCRLFEVTGNPVTLLDDVFGFFELSVVREIDPHLALWTGQRNC